MRPRKLLFITSVQWESDSTLLKIWGQTDKKSVLDIEYSLYKAHTSFEEGQYLVDPKEIKVGELYCSKYNDGKYYRAIIENIEQLREGLVKVKFIDYGNSDTLPVTNLRSANAFNKIFYNLPPQASMFIVAGVVFYGDEWDDMISSKIEKEILYMEVTFEVVSIFRRHKFIRVFNGKLELSDTIHKAKLMKRTAVRVQEKALVEIIEREDNKSLSEYKSIMLEKANRYEVCVCHMEDNTDKFYVQLKEYECELVSIMKDINSAELQFFLKSPKAGTACLAKSLDDGTIYRALIKCESNGKYEVYYVDFGNFEEVPIENLFHIRKKFLALKKQAICVASNNEGLKESLNKYVESRETIMMEFISRNKNYIDDENLCPIVLNMEEKVKVSYVTSNGTFYSQLERHANVMNKLMENLQKYSQTDKAALLKNPKIGQLCCVKFTDDGLWYRGLIKGFKGGVAEVQHIDFGDHQDIPVEDLREIDDYFTRISPIAIKCCCADNQNQDLLIPDEELVIKVVEVINNEHVVKIKKLISIELIE